MQYDILNKYKSINMLIAGQVLTSRTETLEEYYRNEVNYLGILGISNPYARKGLSKCKLYKNGQKIKEFPLFNVQLKGVFWLNQLLLAPVFIMYGISMLIAVKRLKKTFDVFIGIACFSTLFGILLNKIGIVENVIYYTLDYYPKPKRLHINTLINKTIWHLDKYCCKNVSFVWNISQRIPEARERLMNFGRDQYKHILVPLTYNENLLCFRNLEEIEINTLVFVGTLSENQGLQVVVESISDLIKTKPAIKVRIIGSGPDEYKIRQLVRDCGLDDRFIFHGFLKKEKDVLDIISRCAIGICTWTDEDDNNVIYADPGKPKLYAFCGIPIIITKTTAVAKEINDIGAGIAIDYDKKQFVNAVLKILENKGIYEKYRENVNIFANKYTTEKIFENVSEKMLDIIKQRVEKKTSHSFFGTNRMLDK